MYLMLILLNLLSYAFVAYLYLIVGTVIVSWLVVFDVLNTRNKWVYKACNLLNRATNPPILLVRKYLPPLGGIDLSPMVVIFGIYIVLHILDSVRAEIIYGG